MFFGSITHAKRVAAKDINMPMNCKTQVNTVSIPSETIALVMPAWAGCVFPINKKLAIIANTKIAKNK